MVVISELKGFGVLMLVFMDESGCTGLKFKRGSSPYFIITLVVISTPEAAEKISDAIERLRKRLDFWEEFHFQSLHKNIRREFYLMLQNFPVKFYSIILDKSQPYVHDLQKNEIYSEVANVVLGLPDLNGASLYVDKRADKEFRTEFDKSIRNKQNNGKDRRIKKIKHKDWKENSLIQVSDMICGAVSWKTQGKNHYYDMICKYEHEIKEI